MPLEGLITNGSHQLDEDEAMSKLALEYLYNGGSNRGHGQDEQSKCKEASHADVRVPKVVNSVVREDLSVGQEV